MTVGTSSAALLSSKLGLPPIALAFEVAKPFAEPDDWQKGRADGQSNESHADEAVLQSQAVQPRRDAVVDGKAHRVANNDARCQAICRYLSIRVNEICNRQRDARCVAGRKDAHGHNEAEPMDMLSGLVLKSARFHCLNDQKLGAYSDTPEDLASRHQYCRQCKQPKALLGLEYAAIAPRKFDDEPVGDDAAVSRSVK